MSKFKVGDKVRILQGADCWRNMRSPGDVFEIAFIDNNGYRASKVAGDYFGDNEIELVVEENKYADLTALLEELRDGNTYVWTRREHEASALARIFAVCERLGLVAEPAPKSPLDQAAKILEDANRRPLSHQDILGALALIREAQNKA